MDYVLKTGSHRRWEGGKYVSYKSGDVIKNVTLEELKTHRKRLTRVVPKGPAPSLTEEETSKYDKVSEMTVADVAEMIDGIDDVDEVKKLMAAELRDRSRKGVISAASDRIEDLQETSEDVVEE